MENEKKYEILKEKMDDYCWSDWELVGLWNEYCENNNYWDDRIFSMDELDDLFCGCGAIELIDKLSSNFSTSDDYFKDTIYGLESFDNIEDVIEIDDVIEYIIDNDDNLYCDAIRDMLDEIEELEEEEEEE